MRQHLPKPKCTSGSNKVVYIGGSEAMDQSKCDGQDRTACSNAVLDVSGPLSIFLSMASKSSLETLPSSHNLSFQFAHLFPQLHMSSCVLPCVAFSYISTFSQTFSLFMNTVCNNVLHSGIMNFDSSSEHFGFPNSLST